jgi:predicted ferric reductase
MIPRRIKGELFVWLAALMPAFLWLVGPRPEPQGRRGAEAALLTDIGQVTGLVGMAMLAIAFVLASRAAVIEDAFGGLDKVYQAHHRLGRAAFALILAHPLAHAAKFVPDRLDRALAFFLPVHRDTGVDLGVYAFWLFIVLMVPTLFVTIAYDKWKISHKVLGAVLILAALHVLWVSDTPGRPVAVNANPVLNWYMLALAALGVVSFVYTGFVLPARSRRRVFTVRAAERLDERVLQVELQPEDGRFDFIPGQFVFVTFDQERVPREAHPFTICSVPGTDGLVLTVKALGDFTHALHRRLRPGARAWVEGPYGRFDYRAGAPNQLWLAAGVGIAPFLSWARDLAAGGGGGRRVHLYYCVHDRADAVHYDEFQRLAQRVDALDVDLVCTEERGRLRASELGDIRGKDVFMCGPKRFTADLRAQLRRLGVADTRIHFEDFEFR